MQKFIDQTIANRYRVDQFLGRGGMAEVYKVWDKKRSTFLALKMLHEDLAMDNVFLRRFKREAQTLAQLNHPNIVRFYGLEQIGPLAFMLLDYIEGKSLKQLLFENKKHLSDDGIYHILRAVTSALQYAHNQGFVHCDIKPSNIMLDRHGNVFLADFGIARLTDSATATMIGAGTPAYMAPEQVKGFDPTPQTDIYALGVVLFEMLTGGERPFTGDMAITPGSMSAKVRWEQVNLDPPAPETFNPRVSKSVSKIVLTCLAKDPQERFQTPEEMWSAFQKTIQEEHNKQLSPHHADNGPLEEYSERTITAPPELLTSLNSLQKIPLSKASRISWHDWRIWGGGVFILAVLMVIFLANGSRLPLLGKPTDTPLPTNTPTDTLTPTMTLIPSITPTPTITSTPTITPTITSTPKPFSVNLIIQNDNCEPEVVYIDNINSGVAMPWGESLTIDTYSGNHSVQYCPHMYGREECNSTTDAVFTNKNETLKISKSSICPSKQPSHVIITINNPYLAWRQVLINGEYYSADGPGLTPIEADPGYKRFEICVPNSLYNDSPRCEKFTIPVFYNKELTVSE